MLEHFGGRRQAHACSGNLQKHNEREICIKEIKMSLRELSSSKTEITGTNFNTINKQLSVILCHVYIRGQFESKPPFAHV